MEKFLWTVVFWHLKAVQTAIPSIWMGIPIWLWCSMQCWATFVPYVRYVLALPPIPLAWTTWVWTIWYAAVCCPMTTSDASPISLALTTARFTAEMPKFYRTAIIKNHKIRINNLAETNKNSIFAVATKKVVTKKVVIWKTPLNSAL